MGVLVKGGPDGRPDRRRASDVGGLMQRIKRTHGGTDRRIAETIGVPYGTLRDVKYGRSAYSYPLQYTLEQLYAWGYPE